MAFYDWNHDGKKDFTDDFMEYQIYKECTGSNHSYSSSSSSDWWILPLFLLVSCVNPLLGFIVLVLILMFR